MILLSPLLPHVRSDTRSTSQALQPSPDGPSLISQCAISTPLSKTASDSTQEGGSFDPAAAQNIGRDPEALGNLPVTLSLSSTSSGRLSISDHPSSAVSSSSPAPSSTIGNGLNRATSNGHNVPVIVGGLYFNRSPESPSRVDWQLLVSQVLSEEWSVSLAFRCSCFGYTSAVALAKFFLMVSLLRSLTERSLLVVVDRTIRPQSPRTITNLWRTRAVGKSRRYM